MPLVVMPTEYMRASAANLTDTSFTNPAPTATEPTVGNGVFAWDKRNTIRLLPFGTGDNDATFDARIWGWNKAGDLWIPTLICAFTATLSTIVGVSGKYVTNSERFCDTVDVTKGIATEIIAVADVVANASVNGLEVAGDGYVYGQLTVDLTGATSANALWMGL